MDFGAFPPEINSGRMYTGPGSSPMQGASVAWNELAAELRSMATSYQSIIAGLTSDGWKGPASTAMAASAAPYATWMHATASQAEHAAAQTQAAVGAYEAAHAMTVPPPVVAANRSLLMSLVATNFLGQNSPAIAATEAQYGEMWAQDASAMYGYAGDSAAASQVEPFATPPKSSNGEGSEGQASLAQLQSHIPDALQSFATPGDAASSDSGFPSIIDMLFDTGDGTAFSLNSQAWNTLMSTGWLDPLTVGPNMEGFSGAAMLGLVARTMMSGMTGSAGMARAGTGSMGAGLGAASGPTLASGVPGGMATPSTVGGGVAGLGGSSMAAGMNRATLVGALSVPPGWTGSSPAGAPVSVTGTGAGATLGGATPAGATPAGAAPAGAPRAGALPAGGQPGMPGMPGVPIMNSDDDDFDEGVPRYGFKPLVVARPPAAG